MEKTTEEKNKNIKCLLGKRIKILRKARDLTQAKLAETVEVDPKHISCIESGKSFPSPELIGRLAGILKIHPSELFQFDEAPSIEQLKNGILNCLKKANEDEIKKIYIYTKFLIN